MTTADARMAAVLRRFYNAVPPQSPPVQITGFSPAVLIPRQPKYTLPDGTVTTIPEAIRCGEATMRDTMRTIR